MSIEVLLNNSDISVIGPPDTVELQLDVGGKGTREVKYLVDSMIQTLPHQMKLFYQMIYLLERARDKLRAIFINTCLMVQGDFNGKRLAL